MWIKGEGKAGEAWKRIARGTVLRKSLLLRLMTQGLMVHLYTPCLALSCMFSLSCYGLNGSEVYLSPPLSVL